MPLPTHAQAQRFAEAVERLAAAEADGARLDLDAWYGLPAYDEALSQAYRQEMVHGELAADGTSFDIDRINAQPAECVAAMSAAQARHLVHWLYRNERVSHGYGSPVREAIRSGALELAASKIAACCKLAAN
ncbi:hypothetical protein [Methylobacterium sp. 22177]|uniref:hypothetical protein n=1 Tax=Methylobacterium sp. 22177 TaxID=3453885 RepID=UPI003F8767EF